MLLQIFLKFSIVLKKFFTVILNSQNPSGHSNRVVKYLNENFDFESSVYKHFKCLNMDEKLDFEIVLNISKILNVDIDSGILFDEINTFNECLTESNIAKQDLDCVSVL